MFRHLTLASLLTSLCVAAPSARAERPVPPMFERGLAAPMLQPLANSGFSVLPLFTIGEQIVGYRPPGIPDGVAAWNWDRDTLRVFVNHELDARAGYSYELANGTELTGSRVSYFDIDKRSRRVRAAGLAYDRVYDRQGRVVESSWQINERSRSDPRGFGAFCSSAGYHTGERGFVDDLLFLPEEVSALKAHPHGGTLWVLDVRSRSVWALPALGRGAWENVAVLEMPDARKPDGHVALLLSDDIEFGAAPLYLWIGRKRPGGTVAERNGLTEGSLHVWVADDRVSSPEDWHGTGTMRTGRFVAIDARQERRRTLPGYDAEGYRNDDTLRAAARELGAFMFSRPEDLHADPVEPNRVAFASTGHGQVFPADDWGTLYLVDVELAVDAQSTPAASASLQILHDADDFGDYGIRNPDNLVWASDGLIYVQEDQATKLHEFGGKSRREASIWRLDPGRPDAYQRIAEIDRSAAWPTDATDFRTGVRGSWESSGIVDVSRALGAWPDELVLLATVQAHSLRRGSLGGNRDLVQGGQILLLSCPMPCGMQSD